MKKFVRRTFLLIAGYAVLFSIGLTRSVIAASGLGSHNLRIVVSDDGDSTKQIVAAIKSRYPSSEVLASSAAQTKGRNTIDVAVGPAALRTLLENGTDSIIISVFTSSQVFRGLLNKVPKLRTNKVTAVFADPVPADQVQLISRLYKRRVRVGVLVSEATSYATPDLLKVATAANIDLRVERCKPGESPTRALNRLANVTAILAIPDNNVYSTDSIRSILDTTYRRNQAVVGFSPSMVRAGVLASVYSDVEDIVAHLTELISEVENSSLLPMPQHPKYFKVQINDSVARSLNVVVDEPTRSFSSKPAARSP